MSLLPSEASSNQYCQQLMQHLSELANYMTSVGPSKMSKKKLMQVLATLRPWELQTPDVEAAIKVCSQLSQ